MLHTCTCIVEIKELNTCLANKIKECSTNFTNLRIFTIIYSMKFFYECRSQTSECKLSVHVLFCMYILILYCVFITGCSNGVPSARPPGLCWRSPLSSAPSCWTQTPRGQSPWWWTPRIHSPSLLQNCPDNKAETISIYM